MQDTQQTATCAFNVKRWLNYLRLYAGVNRSQLLLCSLLMLAAMLLFTTLMFPSTLPEYAETAQFDSSYFEDIPTMILYYCIMILGLVLFASFMYSSTHGKDKTFSSLSIPASPFEKWLTFFTIYIVGFWATFVVSMALTECYRLTVIGLSGYDIADKTRFITLCDLMPQSDGADSDIIALRTSLLISSLLLVQSIYSLGSIYFRRFSFIVTSLLLGAMSFIIPMLTFISVKLFFNNSGVDMRFEWFESAWNCFWVVTGLACSVIPMLYILGYRRYLQTEIINKW